MPPKQASMGKGGMPPRAPNSSAAPSRTLSANSGRPDKRKQESQGGNSNSDPRASKRAKMYETRSIAVQHPHAALRDGELDVQSFVNSMAFEINALDESMRRTRTSGTSRAFQRVPFTMRRRTAAHNYKRIPKRLHSRAKREMADDNTPTVNSRTRKPKTSRARLRAETARKLGVLARRKRLLKMRKVLGSNTDAITTRAARPKIRRNEPNDLPVTAPRYRKRQLNKTWLPTHMWHAKRARMTPPSEPLWGFSIPLTPTQKNYRPTHRVQWEKGAMAWDMSYMSTIGLFGKENIIRRILEDVGLTQESLWNDKGIRWRAGAMHRTGNLTRKVNNEVQLISPYTTIMWNPIQTLETAESGAPSRQILIRVHPSAFLETFNELLRLTRAYKPRPYLQDLRHEIGSIDVTGPDATEALLGVLKPHKADPKEPHAAKFASLLGLRDPASLPLGALLSFSILDPRLKYPPQKVQPPAAPGQKVQLQLLETISSFQKDEILEPYPLFDRDVRFKSSKLPSQKSLNRRRGTTGPGTTLQPSDIDPAIPIILLASRNGNEAHIPGTWTILLPWKCVQPVWYSLMHYPLSTGGNPTFGGLDEIRQLSFERGQPWFPGDLPGTDAGNAWETRERQSRRKIWGLKPKGKRVKWETVDLGAGRKGEVGVGWSCDFETLFKLHNAAEAETGVGTEPTPAGDDGDGSHDKDHEISGTSEAEKPVQENPTEKGPPEVPPEPLTNITYLPKAIFTILSSSKPPLPIPPNSTITVRIRMLGRGTVSACARIYRLPQRVPAASANAPQAEVPATEPPSTDDGSLKLPGNLFDQWLAQQRTRQQPAKPNAKSKPKSQPRPQNTNVPSDTADTTPQARLQALAQSLTGPPPRPSLYPAPANAAAMNINNHPLCPDARDLVGFATTGAYNLRSGRGEAIATLSAPAAAAELRRYPNPRDARARLCVVRDAGQGVGWLARWDIV
ncbi:POPLD domain-containing protein [Nemania sp. NC0429]|nr:POPLD domain-containing protein [Nemania sp. NC0429]